MCMDMSPPCADSLPFGCLLLSTISKCCKVSAIALAADVRLVRESLVLLFLLVEDLRLFALPTLAFPVVVAVVEVLVVLAM